MSSQAGHSVSPPPIGASSASSGVRRHHTITAASRGSRPNSKVQVSGQDEAEQEEIWNQDEVVDQDWVGGVGAVGEKSSSLHRQSSLPTRYNRGTYPSIPSHDSILYSTSLFQYLALADAWNRRLFFV